MLIDGASKQTANIALLIGAILLTGVALFFFTAADDESETTIEGSGEINLGPSDAEDPEPVVPDADSQEAGGPSSQDKRTEDTSSDNQETASKPTQLDADSDAQTAVDATSKAGKDEGQVDRAKPETPLGSDQESDSPHQTQDEVFDESLTDASAASTKNGQDLDQAAFMADKEGGDASDQLLSGSIGDLSGSEQVSDQEGMSSDEAGDGAARESLTDVPADPADSGEVPDQAAVSQDGSEEDASGELQTGTTGDLSGSEQVSDQEGMSSDEAGDGAARESLTDVPADPSDAGEVSDQEAVSQDETEEDASGELQTGTTGDLSGSEQVSDQEGMSSDEAVDGNTRESLTDVPVDTSDSREVSDQEAVSQDETEEDASGELQTGTTGDLSGSEQVSDQEGMSSDEAVDGDTRESLTDVPADPSDSREVSDQEAVSQDETEEDASGELRTDTTGDLSGSEQFSDQEGMSSDKFGEDSTDESLTDAKDDSSKLSQLTKQSESMDKAAVEDLIVSNMRSEQPEPGQFKSTSDSTSKRSESNISLEAQQSNEDTSQSELDGLSGSTEDQKNESSLNETRSDTDSKPRVDSDNEVQTANAAEIKASAEQDTVSGLGIHGSETVHEDTAAFPVEGLRTHESGLSQTDRAQLPDTPNDPSEKSENELISITAEIEHQKDEDDLERLAIVSREHDLTKNAIPSQPSQSPIPVITPQFDLVRIDQKGLVTIAGKGSPAANIQVLVNGEIKHEQRTNRKGDFAMLFLIKLTDEPIEIALQMLLGDGQTIDSKETALLLPSDIKPIGSADVALPTLAGNVQSQTSPMELPSQPTILLSSAEGLRLMQPPLPILDEQRLVETVTYNEQGEAVLAGRATALDKVIRIYINNDYVKDELVREDLNWSTKLEDVQPGRYTLRVDEISPDGTVANRVEMPFQKEAEDFVRSAMLAALEASTAELGVDTTPLTQLITVQRGYTLWGISRSRYGLGRLYVNIFDLNKDLIKDPNLIYPGQVFKIPGIIDLYDPEFDRPYQPNIAAN